MKIYDTIEEYNRLEGPPLASGPGEFRTEESDWGTRLSAPSLGHLKWLLTFLRESRSSGGTLVAYEIGGDFKTGRIAVLKREWTTELDEAERTRLWVELPWRPDLRDTPAGEANLDEIEAGLQGPRVS